MGSERALIFDYILLVGLAVLLFAGISSLVRSRRDGGSKTDRWSAGAAGFGGLILLVLFGADAFDAVRGANRDVYPDAATPLLVLGFLGLAGLGLAAYDSISARAAQFADRYLRSDLLRSAVVPTLILVIVVGLAGTLWKLDPLRTPSSSQTTPTTAPAVRPSSLTLTALPIRVGVDPPDVPSLTLTAITEHGDLQLPTYLVSPPDDDRLFVLERLGRIRVIDEQGLRPDPVLDITDLVGPGSDGGLIGLAFHPDFADNGRMFVHYTDTDDDNTVVEYRLDPATASLSAQPPIELFHIEKPDMGLHAGGMLQFGPDGYLYIAVGDPNPSSAQDPNSNRGILRVDVDGGTPYAIPDVNAFGDREPNETFAYGLRNPYRFWIDPTTNQMFIGDVGEATWEGIDVVALDNPGVNFGWNIVEGTLCFPLDQGFIEHCDRTGFTEPIFTYRNFRANPPDVTGGGCAVILGSVYRGPDMPELDGTIFYADYCNKWIGGFRYEDGKVVDSVLWEPIDDLTLGTPISFGADSDGEMYLLTSAGGMIYRFGQG